MKKLINTAAFLLASPLAAADFIGVYAGAGSWDASFDGDIGDVDESISSDELGIDDDSSTFFYIALEHPVPVLPNVMLKHTPLEVEGASTIDRSFTLDEVTFPAAADTVTDIDLTHTDITLYYEVLDNWVSLDLGITARLFDAFAEVVAEVDPGPTVLREKIELEDPVPLLYAAARFDLPFSGWHAGGSINYIGYSGDSFSDIDVSVGYMTDGLGLDFGVDVGYREMRLDIDDLEDLSADVTVDGFYASLVLHF